MKMEPLVSTKQMLIWLCICPSPKSTTKSERLAHVMCAIVVFLGNLFGTITHGMFLSELGSIDVKGRVFSFMGIVAFGSMLYIMITVFLHRHQTRSILEQLSKIYEIYESSNTFKFLGRASEASEKVCKFYIRYTMFIVCSNIFLSNATAIISSARSKGQFDATHAFHISRLYVPWNRSTLWGYIGEENFVCYCGTSFMVASGVNLLLFISMCFHHRAFLEMFDFSIYEWNHLNAHTNLNDEEFILKLIQFHVLVKNWFLQTIDLYSHVVLVQLMASTIILSTTVFYLDLQIHDLDFEVFFVICLSTIALVNLFVYCYFGKIGSDSFASMPNSLYVEMNWRNLKPKLQMYMVLMIRNMQKPVFYSGFSVTIMDLNTFIRLLRMVGTFYMVFKAVTTT